VRRAGVRSSIMRSVTWTNFYITIATAAATLLGLLFVAVQFNLQQLPASHPQQWLATARATFVVFASLFLLPAMSLIPGQGHQGLVLETGVVAVVSGWRIIVAWLPYRKEVVGERARAVRHALWLTVGPLVFYALIVGSTIAYPPKSARYTVAYLLVMMFALAMRNSWHLLVELRVANEQRSM